MERLQQSSSATMGLVLALATNGVIPLPIALAIMLGAEIGTWFDAIVAAFGRGVEPMKVALFQLAYNVAAVGIGIAALPVMIDFATWSSSDVANQVANTQLAFNLIGGARGSSHLPPWPSFGG